MQSNECCFLKFFISDYCYKSTSLTSLIFIILCIILRVPYFNFSILSRSLFAASIFAVFKIWQYCLFRDKHCSICAQLFSQIF